MKTSSASKSETGPSASERIDARIRELEDWRGKTLASLRKTILDADPEIIEEWKWMGSPVWSRDGMIAVGNAHKDKVKLTFSHGASLPDPDKLFNNGLNGKVWRAIDVSEGEGWFLSLHCFTRYVKVAFFRGMSLDPIPPGASKQKDVRYLDIHEGEEIDEARFASWVKQASKLPGEKM